MTTQKGLWIKAFFTVAWLQFIFLLSVATYFLLAPSPGDTFDSYWDKFLHVVCWFVLLGSLKLPCILRENFWKIALGLFAYSFGIEVLQHFMPPRTFSLWDAFANGLGVSMAFALTIVLEPLVNRFLKPLLVK